MIPFFQRRFSILQFGTGGTGSWLIPSVAKFLNNIGTRDQEHIDREYVLIDYDIVEDRNILRQNFVRDDISQFKSEVLSRQYCYVYPSITFDTSKATTPKKMGDIFAKYIMNEPQSTIFFIFGCVDSNKIRKLLYKTIKECETNVIYIDSGNNLYNGQIVTSIFGDFTDILENWETFKNINFNKFFKSTKEETTQSCAFFGDQSQSINLFASTLMFMNFQKILIENTLPANLINFNSSGFSSFQIGG